MTFEQSRKEIHEKGLLIVKETAWSITFICVSGHEVTISINDVPTYINEAIHGLSKLERAMK